MPGSVRRNNVVLRGREDRPPMVFAHGFGCDQNMWRYVWPAFASEYRIVLFDHVGAGGSDVLAYDPQRYSSLQGYAADVLDICHELELSDLVFVGHSVSAMIGGLVQRDGSGDHGQFRPAGVGGGVDEQLLPRRSGDRGAVCSRDVPVG